MREAIHAVFLYHAIHAGMDMGIVNAGALALYDDLDADLRERVEDVVLNRRADATERLLEIAETLQGQEGRGRGSKTWRWRELPVRERLEPRAGARHRRTSSRPTPKRRAGRRRARWT